LKSPANGFSGVEVIRTRVQNFMQYSVGKWQRFIIIDESDRMGHDCQEILTSLIEKYPKTRTIWTLNDIDNIMDRIVDRASGGVFEFKKPEPRQIVPRLRQIARSEKAHITEQRLKEIAKNASSVRNAIGMLQQECVLVKAARAQRK
jgi:DNA polymerase III delta prime subunit